MNTSSLRQERNFSELNNSLLLKTRKSLSSLSASSNVLKNLKYNEELNKLRVVLNKKDNDVTIRQRRKNSLKSIKTELNENINLSNINPISINSTDNNLYVYNKYNKTQKRELTSIQKKIDSLVEMLSNNQGDIINECDRLWNMLSNSSIVKEENMLLSAKNAVQSSWSLLYFSIIISYDQHMKINCKINHHQQSDNQQAIIYIKNAFVFHSKINKFILLHFLLSSSTSSSSLLSQNDIIQFNQSLNSLLTSITSMHKLVFANYHSQKYNEFISLWNKIPNISLVSLEALYTKIKSSQLIKEDAAIMPQSIQIPLLPKQKEKEYTLVLDLDETLIRYKEDTNDSTKGTVIYRPGLITFLANVCPYYELVLFTMSLKQYADTIVDNIEKDRVFFNKRLYREHSTFLGNTRVKDLMILGRDLQSTIIIDDIERNFILQKENGILIKPYYGNDDNDLTLIDLIPILVKIAKDKMDIRSGLKVYRKYILSINTISNGNTSKKCLIK